MTDLLFFKKDKAILGDVSLVFLPCFNKLQGIIKGYKIVANKRFISVFNQGIRRHRIWWPNGRGWRRRLMGSNWGRQLRWGSSQDHFEGLQGPSQREGHRHAHKNIGGQRQRRQTRQTGRCKI
jgi:hypothetical protein